MMPAWKRKDVPGRLLEYAFTEDHVVQGEIMQRREVLRMLAVGAALPVLPPSLLAHLQEAQAQVGSSYKLRTLIPQQNALVVTMIDLIIPVTDTPGAKAARVNEFIDVILTDWATETERQAFLDGLAKVDQRSNELFGKNFVDASVDQQTTLLRAMDDAAMAAHSNRPRVRHGNTIPEERDKQLQGNFWDVFKGITVHGYYTSEIGFTQEENLQIIPGAYHGCVPLTDQKKA
jgi:glucoside 3-dehydrogenase (cytochrome c) hitch-hiker subunit